jgi:hypothetical protein
MAANPNGGTSAGAEITKAAGGVVAALGGLVALILVCGAGALTLRAAPATGASVLEFVPQVPRDVLISLGVEVAALPAVFGVIYALTRAVDEADPPTESRRFGQNKRWWIFLVLAVVLPPLAPTAYATFAGVHRPWWLPAGAVVIAAIGFVLVFVATKLRQGLATECVASVPADEQDEHSLRRAWKSLNNVAAVSLLVALTTFPGSAYMVGSLPLQKAIVCIDTGERIKSYLLGEGANGTFVVQAKYGGILSLPAVHVLRVWSGPNIWHGDPKAKCP